MEFLKGKYKVRRDYTLVLLERGISTPKECLLHSNMLEKGREGDFKLQKQLKFVEHQFHLNFWNKQCYGVEPKIVSAIKYKTKEDN